MMQPYNPNDMTVPLSGMHAPGNSLTSAGPTQEPFGAGDVMMDKKKQMALALIAQQMGSMGGQSALGAPQRPRQALDIYGNPVQGA
jgi:hypothetical protein